MGVCEVGLIMDWCRHSFVVERRMGVLQVETQRVEWTSRLVPKGHLKEEKIREVSCF